MAPPPVSRRTTESVPAGKGDRPSVTIGVYMKKVDIKLLKKDIEKLRYAGLDLDGLVGPAPEGRLPLSRSEPHEVNIK